MSSNRLAVQSERLLYKVDQWKDEPDPQCPWWERFYYHWIHLPVLRFSYRVMHIPAPKEVTVEGKQVKFTWFEDQGVFEYEDQAVSACYQGGPRWGYKPIPLNSILPPESLRVGPKVYPAAKRPNREAKLNFELVATPKQVLRQIKHSVSAIDRILDQ